MSATRFVPDVFKDAAHLMLGAAQFSRHGDTPPAAYQSMIQMFCRTGGRSNDALSSLLSLARPPVEFDRKEGIVGGMSEEEQRRVADDLRRDGFHVFARKLPDDICDRLLAYATSQGCVQRATDKVLRDENVDRFPRGAPLAVRYDFREQDLTQNVDVQNLMADPSLAAVAQDYLGSSPILDITALWWNAAFQGAPDKNAAQFWHFDMDRLKWLKFFIYLTDVGPDNGPHTFVAGTHRRGEIPSELLSRGYARLTDEEVERHYAKNRFIEFSAPRGTIIAEDTRGLHKGKNVARDDRLVLQFQYTNSLFGGRVDPIEVAVARDSKLEKMHTRYPRMFSRYAVKY